MCVLCEKENLRLLVAPLEHLSPREFADSVALAREAAWQLVLDTADALNDTEPVDAMAIGPDGYLEYIVERAERDGVTNPTETLAWNAAIRDGTVYHDARVQAFLSSAAEGLASYLLQVRDYKESLEQFLEDRSGTVAFAGVGPSGEVLFDRGEERYVVLCDEEALRIAMDRLANSLCDEDPRILLHYTNLPLGAVDVLAAMQQGPVDRANDILAGIVDLHALTEDRVRQQGYARYVAEGVTDEFAEQRFGDRIIVRLRMPQQSPLE